MGHIIATAQMKLNINEMFIKLNTDPERQTTSVASLKTSIFRDHVIII